MFPVELAIATATCAVLGTRRRAASTLVDRPFRPSCLGCDVIGSPRSSAPLPRSQTTGVHVLRTLACTPCSASFVAAVAQLARLLVDQRRKQATRNGTHTHTGRAQFRIFGPNPSARPRLISSLSLSLSLAAPTNWEIWIPHACRKMTPGCHCHRC